METIRPLLEAYGYWLLLGVGFAEFAGLPIASVPVLVLAGAFAAHGHLNLGVAVLSAAAGGLAADLGWYAVSRWRGNRLVSTVCGLTSNPRACALAVADRLSRVGPIYIVPSKFIPGTANLIAAAAGMAGLRTSAFLAADAAALLLWAGAYGLLGFFLSSQVGLVVAWIAGYARWALALVALLIAGASAWRLVRARMHRAAHGTRVAGAA